jgi:hypothetical protein
MIKLGAYTFYSKHKNKVEEVFNFDQLALLTLSVLESRNWFKRLYLFTDNLGASVLNDALDLPFDFVATDIQDFIPHPFNSFWAMSKIKTYSLLVEPFCHIDNDVILYNGLPDYIQEASLFAQNAYTDDPLKFAQTVNYLPPVICRKAGY